MSWKRLGVFGIAALVVAPVMTGGPARAQSNDPFSAPQYLIHATGHATRSGPVVDDTLVLLPEAPDDDGTFASADGNGGLFHWSSDFHAGPFREAGRPSRTSS